MFWPKHLSLTHLFNLAVSKYKVRTTHNGTCQPRLLDHRKGASRFFTLVDSGAAVNIFCEANHHFKIMNCQELILSTWPLHIQPCSHESTQAHLLCISTDKLPGLYARPLHTTWQYHAIWRLRGVKECGWMPWICKPATESSHRWKHKWNILISANPTCPTSLRPTCHPRFVLANPCAAPTLSVVRNSKSSARLLGCAHTT